MLDEIHQKEMTDEIARRAMAIETEFRKFYECSPDEKKEDPLALALSFLFSRLAAHEILNERCVAVLGVLNEDKEKRDAGLHK